MPPGCLPPALSIYRRDARAYTSGSIVASHDIGPAAAAVSDRRDEDEMHCLKLND